MKKLVLFVLCLFGLFSISSCEGISSSIEIGVVDLSTLTCKSKKYVKFSGVDSFVINITEETTVHVDIVTEAGDFALKIGEDSFNGSNMETCSFDVVLKEAGSYNVVVTAKNHKGSYKISW